MEQFEIEAWDYEGNLHLVCRQCTNDLLVMKVLPLSSLHAAVYSHLCAGPVPVEADHVKTKGLEAQMEAEAQARYDDLAAQRDLEDQNDA